ncbi:MAG: aminofutalosine synthase MqnE [Thermoguttaceae bacterium]
MNTAAATLEQIGNKVHSGRRLSADDGQWLFSPAVDLHTIGQLADLVRRRRSGNTVYYNINAHLNPTNVCVYRCPLCAYSCDAADAAATMLDEEELLARGQEAAGAGCTELHIVGGAHPTRPLEWHVALLGRLHRAYPRLHLKALTAVEVAWLAERAGRSATAVLEDLMAAGLGSLPGGGAEIFASVVRRQICPAKADAKTWLEVHRAAHRLGLPSNATMLFGHVETTADRVDHLLQLRQLQDETGGFQAFVPLVFHPQNTQLAALPKASPLEQLRTLAVSRLMLDNFPHVKAYWVSLGVGVAQVALGYGADDLDGTVRHERIHHDAGAQSPQVLDVEQLQALVRETGREPVERDSLYRRVVRNGRDWEVVPNPPLP